MITEELAKLTPEEKRVLIAELCGKHQYFGILYPGEKCTKCQAWIDNEVHKVGDYLNDLNAMHAAEQMLTTEKQCESYAFNLAIICKGFPSDPFHGPKSYMWHATAAQRADAFLLTLG